MFTILLHVVTILTIAGIGEIDATAFIHPKVVRTVELFALVFVNDRFAITVLSYLVETAPLVFADDQVSILVDPAAVGTP